MYIYVYIYIYIFLLLVRSVCYGSCEGCDLAFGTPIFPSYSGISKRQPVSAPDIPEASHTPRRQSSCSMVLHFGKILSGKPTRNEPQEGHFKEESRLQSSSSGSMLVFQSVGVTEVRILKPDTCRRTHTARPNAVRGFKRSECAGHYLQPVRHLRRRQDPFLEVVHLAIVASTVAFGRPLGGFLARPTPQIRPRAQLCQDAGAW